MFVEEGSKLDYKAAHLNTPTTSSRLLLRVVFVQRKVLLTDIPSPTNGFWFKPSQEHPDKRSTKYGLKRATGRSSLLLAVKPACSGARPWPSINAPRVEKA
jgi:hypothetical protein